ncbi:rRNA-binding ribosome biosynthesis protein utp25, partial [Coemansia helicoidea]
MPPARKSRGLSRKELQHLKEYGELDPLNSAGDDRNLDEAISSALSRSKSGRFSGKLGSRRGGSLGGRGGRRGAPKPAQQRGAKPDAYLRLLRSLTATGAEAAPTSGPDDSGDDASDASAASESAADSGDEAPDRLDSGAEQEEQDKEPAQEIDMVEPDNGSDDDDDDDDAAPFNSGAQDDEAVEAYAAHDFMDRHYADSDSELAHRRLAAVNSREYSQVPLEDAVLGAGVVCNVAGEGVQEANPQPLKQKLVGPFHKLNNGQGMTELQQRFFGWLDQYRDVACAGRTPANEDELTTMYALHAMNHVMKARERERKNNARLAKAHATGADAGELRDRGFTRPRVLILLPFRSSALRVIEKLLKLTSADKEANSARLAKEYGPDEDEVAFRSRANARKPADYQQTFADNIDDSFRVGLQLFHRSVKLFADFYRSDIIVASPIGLRMTTGAQSGDRKDFDFLSSIEMVIVDQCDVLLMQNWDHVMHAFKHMNQMPKKDHGCDFSRVRSWCLDGMARFRRQTVLLSAYMTPEIQAAFNGECRSIAGKVRFKPAYPGAVADVVAQVAQVFRRVPVARLASADDDRFAHFVDHALPELDKTVLGNRHAVIFAASYFDFVRLRNH